MIGAQLLYPALDISPSVVRFDKGVVKRDADENHRVSAASVELNLILHHPGGATPRPGRTYKNDCGGLSRQGVHSRPLICALASALRPRVEVRFTAMRLPTRRATNTEVEHARKWVKSRADDSHTAVTNQGSTDGECMRTGIRYAPGGRNLTHRPASGHPAAVRPDRPDPDCSRGDTQRCYTRTDRPS